MLELRKCNLPPYTKYLRENFRRVRPNPWGLIPQDTLFLARASLKVSVYHRPIIVVPVTIVLPATSTEDSTTAPRKLWLVATTPPAPSCI